MVMVTLKHQAHMTEKATTWAATLDYLICDKIL
jgi:hypothetical protein